MRWRPTLLAVMGETVVWQEGEEGWRDWLEKEGDWSELEGAGGELTEADEVEQEDLTEMRGREEEVCPLLLHKVEEGEGRGQRGEKGDRWREQRRE